MQPFSHRNMKENNLKPLMRVLVANKYISFTIINVHSCNKDADKINSRQENKEKKCLVFGFKKKSAI